MTSIIQLCRIILFFISTIDSVYSCAATQSSATPTTTTTTTTSTATTTTTGTGVDQLFCALRRSFAKLTSLGVFLGQESIDRIVEL